MKTVFSEINSQRLLDLTKAALHGTNPDENLFVDATEADWDELFEQSLAQGVMALSLNGAMRLPNTLQKIAFPVKLRWVASVEAVEKHYRHCMETAMELSALFRKNNIPMLLFKGVALSRLYPVPASREFGDIDISFCGKSEEGNAILERFAVKKRSITKKHSNFFYKGILIESHHNFIGNKSFQHSEYLEMQLMALLTEAGIPNETFLAESGQTVEPLLFPPPDFDALFVTLHTFSHMSSRIVLRQLCDLTVIFTAYKGKIDFTLYRNTLSKAGLLKLADAFISLSVKYLGLNPEYAPPYESDLSLEKRIWDDLLNPEICAFPIEKRSLLNIIIYKIKLLRSRYWKSELVFPGQYGKKIIFSILFHLRFPKTITKLF